MLTTPHSRATAPTSRFGSSMMFREARNRGAKIDRQQVVPLQAQHQRLKCNTPVTGSIAIPNVHTKRDDLLQRIVFHVELKWASN
jgi:hypothetical protein